MQTVAPWRQRQSLLGFVVHLSWCNVVLPNVLFICLHISLFCIIYPLTFYLFLLPAVPKQEDEGTHVPSHVQENVFIEGSRPKYLEDLHTEAREGLKLQQQEETNNGVDYQDDQSIASTVTRQPDETESDSYRERRGSLSDSTILDTMSQVSTRSAVSTRSSRSGLTRQASTFRPLKSEKKPEKTKARRRHRRTTVMGIPQHIQRELGLDRASWAARRVIDEDGLHNGESLDIHTIDGPHLADSQEGVRIYLQSVEGLQPVSEDQVQKFPSRAGHTDDLALLQRMGPQLCGLKRPNSLAVPWMTTVPVMSMSPQATYMSKIIPNAPCLLQSLLPRLRHVLCLPIQPTTLL
ncbi:unnamed protein product [Oncorhynchus mykiss]|uniref:Uncharacterized protein n=1 Tax=Oncorhynchus mykiss TaxID=8022 RepID=A0A060YZI6_ONCMY|nr:unnamed protein product [Oncorhynchus mykiss]